MPRHLLLEPFGKHLSKGSLYLGIRVAPSHEKFDVTSFMRRACSSGVCFL
jgi:hypothetical protein